MEIQEDDFLAKYFKNEGDCHPKLAYQALSKALSRYLEGLDPVDKFQFQADMHPYIKEVLEEAKKMEKMLGDASDIILIEPEKVYTINPNLKEMPKAPKQIPPVQEVTMEIKPISDTVGEFAEEDFSLPDEWGGADIGETDDIPFGLFVPNADKDAGSEIQHVGAEPAAVADEDKRTPEEIQEDMKKAILMSSSRLFNNITTATEVSHQVEPENTPPVQIETQEHDNGAVAMEVDVSPQSEQSGDRPHVGDEEDDFADSFIVGKQIH